MRAFDTSPEAYEFQLRRLRAMSPGRKIELTAELCEVARELSRAGIRMRHPEYSEQEVNRAFFRLAYGAELTAKVFPSEKAVLP